MEENNNHKEIIYLDSTELSSALAQLDHGLMQSIQKSNGSSKKDSTSKSRHTDGGFDIGVNLGVKSTAKGKVTVGHNNLQENTDSQQELINITFSDYQLEQLIDDLQNNNMLKEINNSSEGDFVKINSTFDILDLEGLSNLNYKLYETFMRSSGSTRNEAHSAAEGFKNIQSFGKVMSTVLPGLILIRTNDSISFLEKNNLRMSSGQTQVLAGSTRKINVLGIVESKALSGERSLDGNDFAELSNIGRFVPAFSDMLLQTSGIIKKGDKIIKPIALYF